MRITQKIATGFSVLLVLLLLMGVVSISTLENIESTNVRVLAEFPQLTDKVMDMRRYLISGLKGSTSYFLTGKECYWEEGQLNFQKSHSSLDSLINDLSELSYVQSYKKDLVLLKENLTRFNALSTEAKGAETEHKQLRIERLSLSNSAMNLAIQYQDSVLERLENARKSGAEESVNALLLTMAQAQTLTSNVTDTRHESSLAYMKDEVVSVDTNKDLLDKDLSWLRPLLEKEEDPQPRLMLENLEKALIEGSKISNKSIVLHGQVNTATAQLAIIESTLLNASRAMVDALRDSSLQKLADQNALTHNTGNTLIVFLVGSLIFGMLFAGLLMRNIRAALTRCLHLAQAVKDGDLTQRLPEGHKDEMGLIAESMNSMLDNLHATIDEARQKEHEAIEAKQQAEDAKVQSDQANRAKDDFLARMSHEIRTPMNAIIGLGHLCQQTRLDEQQRQYITKILGSANDLLGILNEILDFSKIEDGKLELDCLPFQLQVVMENLARIMGQRSREKGLVFKYTVSPHIPQTLHGDPLRLTQVLINLVGNGVKFTEKGSVTLAVDCIPQEGDDIALRFSITDTGIGMDPEQYQHVLQPFVQADGSNTRRFGGTGLGLSISQRLVSLMGGTIEAESNPYGGSIFRFSVPLHAGEIDDRGSTELKNIHALVVDDDSLTQQVVASNLTSLGMCITTANSGQEALEAITAADNADKPFSIIVLDWRMPDMNGIETASRIGDLALRHSQPALLMHSDYGLEEVQKMAEAAGISAFLPKPATPAVFQKIIQELLGTRAEHSAKQETASQPETAQAAAGATRILLVEDNEINQEIACELLKMAQLDVDTVNNGQEAVDAVKNENYALIFMDVQMPVMDGLEATRNIRAAGYTMPIIAMTAHAMRGDKEISLAAGMNDHLTKPLDPQALFATLNQWLPFAPSTTHDDSPSAPQEIALRQSGLPQSIDGFNLTAGLAAVGGNEELYASLLSKFAGRYATITEDITACLQNNDLETAVRLAHTVKGIAANLGAESLAVAAGQLEKTITHDPSMTTPHLKTLVLRLADAVTAVWTALGHMGADYDDRPRQAVSERLDREAMEKTCHALEQAISNMEMDWETATNEAQQVLTLLQGTHLEDQASQLIQAVEDFETEEAQESSQQLQAALRLAFDAQNETPE